MHLNTARRANGRAECWPLGTNPHVAVPEPPFAVLTACNSSARYADSPCSQRRLTVVVAGLAGSIRRLTVVDADSPCSIRRTHRGRLPDSPCSIRGLAVSECATHPGGDGTRGRRRRRGELACAGDPCVAGRVGVPSARRAGRGRGERGRGRGVAAGVPGPAGGRVSRRWLRTSRTPSHSGPATWATCWASASSCAANAGASWRPARSASRARSSAASCC